MFTGIIEELGVVKQNDRGPKGQARQPGRSSVELVILAKIVPEHLSVGESVAVNGVCLTVVRFSSAEVAVDLSPETQAVTTLGAIRVGDAVNLERALRFSDRLGGHLVSGHVDGIGRIRNRRAEGDCWVLSIEAPPEVLKYSVRKGSIAVDGVSLTINDLSEKDLHVTIIPHTAKMTTLGLKGAGDPVNLESDLIGKYVARLLQAGETKPLPEKIDIDYLRRNDLL